MLDTIAERTHGKWLSILSAIGVPSAHLNGKHGPCPFCGGKDRFRWTNHQGSGSWVCNQCDKGTGTDFVMRFLSLDFIPAMKRIDEAIGIAKPDPIKRQSTTEDERRAMRFVWGSGRTVTRDDQAGHYLASRGIVLDKYPGCLRFSDRVRYYPGDDNQDFCYYPAMLAQVISPSGKAVNVHRTYLADVPTRRKMMRGDIPTGSAIRLGQVDPVMGAAEGIETALSASTMRGMPVWSTWCADMLAGFKPPSGVRELHVFADNDANHKGALSAYTLAHRVCRDTRGATSTFVHMPEGIGKDWNDILCAPLQHVSQRG